MARQVLSPLSLGPGDCGAGRVLKREDSRDACATKGVGDKTWLVVAFRLRPAVSEDIGAKARFFGEGGKCYKQ